MKRILTSLAVLTTLASSTNAQVWINELVVNVPGGDGTFEMFELRGTPGASLSGYYLISLEGEGATTKGDINQFLDFTTYSLGANGFLVGRQFSSPYGAINPNATLLQSSTGPGWAQTGVYSSDGTPGDMENSATTLLLVNIGIGAAPVTTLDMDADNDGLLEIPAGWSIVDSIGLIDSVGVLAENRTYGAINFRVGTLGDSAYGNVIQLPGAVSTSLYVGRKGDTTGSTTADWFAATMAGTGPNFTMVASTTTDPYYAGNSLPDMVFGGPNPVPEPGSLALLGLGCLALFLRRKSR